MTAAVAIGSSTGTIRYHLRNKGICDRDEMFKRDRNAKVVIVPKSSALDIRNAAEAKEERKRALVFGLQRALGVCKHTSFSASSRRDMGRI